MIITPLTKDTVYFTRRDLAVLLPLYQVLFTPSPLSSPRTRSFAFVFALVEMSRQQFQRLYFLGEKQA